MTPCQHRMLWLDVDYLIRTKGSLFFTSRTIFTDSSSKSSSKFSGRGGRTGSKFFCATVSWTTSIACVNQVRNSNTIEQHHGFQFSPSRPDSKHKNRHTKKRETSPKAWENPTPKPWSRNRWFLTGLLHNSNWRSQYLVLKAFAFS